MKTYENEGRGDTGIFEGVVPFLFVCLERHGAGRPEVPGAGWEERAFIVGKCV